MKTTLLVFILSFSSLASALSVCNTDCQLAKSISANNSHPSLQFLTSDDLKHSVYSDAIDLKKCKTKGPEVSFDRETGEKSEVKTIAGSGVEALAYLNQWESLKDKKISKQLYKKLEKEFTADRKFCFGFYAIDGAWFNETSNFVRSEDGTFFFAEVFSEGP